MPLSPSPGKNITVRHLSLHFFGLCNSNFLNQRPSVCTHTEINSKCLYNAWNLVQMGSNFSQKMNTDVEMQALLSHVRFIGAFFQTHHSARAVPFTHTDSLNTILLILLLILLFRLLIIDCTAIGMRDWHGYKKKKKNILAFLFSNYFSRCSPSCASNSTSHSGNGYSWSCGIAEKSMMEKQLSQLILNW